MMSNGTTTNEELYSASKRLRIPVIAVLPSDYAPYQLKRPNTAIVLNTEDSTSSGEHWVAVMRGESPRLYFYDSFRRSPSNLSSHWKNKPWTYFINEPEQSLPSEHCGQMTLAMVSTFMKYGPSALKVI